MTWDPVSHRWTTPSRVAIVSGQLIILRAPVCRLAGDLYWCWQVLGVSVSRCGVDASRCLDAAVTTPKPANAALSSYSRWVLFCMWPMCDELVSAYGCGWPIVGWDHCKNLNSSTRQGLQMILVFGFKIFEFIYEAKVLSCVFRLRTIFRCRARTGCFLEGAVRENKSKIPRVSTALVLASSFLFGVSISTLWT